MNLHEKTTKTNSGGFTLIELLLVVIIISVLSGVILTVVNVAGLRQKARDSQRIGDLERIQLALELYYADHRHYPISGAWLQINGTDTLSTELTGTPTYINNMPLDPDLCNCGNLGPCFSPHEHRYNYRTSSTGTFYILTALMEVSTSDDISKCRDLNYWTDTTCGVGGAAVCGCTAGDTWNGDPDYCYGVESPF